MSETEAPPKTPDRKQRLIEAAVWLMLKGGYSATTVDQVCAEAGVTKGSFFHYFSNKEEIAKAAMDAWYGGWEAFIEEAKLDEIPDPYTRLGKLFDIMIKAYIGSPETGCLVGTIAQEMALSHRNFCDLADGHFEGWLRITRKLLRDAKEASPPKIDFNVDDLSLFMISMVQGCLLVSKTQPTRQVIVASVGHCRNYVELVFGKPFPKEVKP